MLSHDRLIHCNEHSNRRVDAILRERAGLQTFPSLHHPGERFHEERLWENARGME